MSLAFLFGATVAASLSVPGSLWARVRVSIAYRWRHGYFPNLDRPRKYNEWVQWRKLNDRDERLAILTDKSHAKALAGERIGSDHVIPTLWRGTALPADPPCPMPFVVKANHGCRQVIVVRSLDDWCRAKRLSPRWLRGPYGKWLDEWHYGRAQRSLLIEPFIGSGEACPLDYKVFVFGGRARFVQVHVDRASNHRWIQFDREWNPLSVPGDVGLKRPQHLDAMLCAAERMASGFDHLRVDFYEEHGRMWFGETCLFAGSGLDRFNPVSLDDLFGAHWSAARAAAT